MTTDADLPALAELVALVRGECPSLLDEGSGGDARLSMQIDAALAEQPASVPDGWRPRIVCGPNSHICWTPDAPTSPKPPLVLITHEDYLRVCAALAAAPKPEDTKC